jgi:uncharacterized damage-inducible protein DinB
MSRATQLANHIERTVTGPMWHGPALLEVLKGVACDQALARPLPDAHSIWELVLHVTAWCDIARQRLRGEATGDPTPEQDWPPVPDTLPKRGEVSGVDPAAEWRRAVERLAESHRELAADTRLLDDDRLGAPVPGLDYRVSVLLRGIVEHGTYHGGQIALLRKAVDGQGGGPGRPVGGASSAPTTT